MKSCEEFEVDVEKRLHGALDPASSQSLIVHLASCASCRSFEALAGQTEKTMTSEAVLSSEGIDWAAMRDRLTASLKADYRETLKRGALISLLMSPLVIAASSQSLGAAALSFAAMWLLMGLALGVRNWLRIHRIQRHQDDRGEFLYLYRQDLERRLRRTQRLLAVPLLCLALWFRHFQHGEAFGSLQGLSLLGITLISLGAALYGHFAKRPQLQQQIDNLRS